VLIVTSGSVGDAAPYTGLGARLQAAGHDVTVASHAPFEATFAAAGLPFRATCARSFRRRGARTADRRVRAHARSPASCASPVP